MSILPLTVPPKKLAQTISSTAMSFKLNNILSWRGVALTPADFGTEAYCTFINSTRTQIEIVKIDPATIASASITILQRGLGYSGGDTPLAARQFAWPSNDTTVQLGTDAPQLFRDFMSASNTATVTAVHTYNTLPETAVTPTTDNQLVRKKYVDDKTGSALAVPVAQVAHGFVVGDVIRVSGINTYTKAQANNNVNAEVVGIVNTVTNVDNFTYTTEGAVTAGVPAVAAGTVLFLSPTTAGALTATEPTTIGHVSLPLAIVTENATRMIFHKFRGAVLNTIAGNPIASETVAGIVEQATPAQVAAKTDTGETGAPLFVIPSLIPSVPAVNVQTFSTPGAYSWIKPTSGRFVIVELASAGGGGADGQAPQNNYASAGGGGGGVVRLFFNFSDFSGNVAGLVGAGGSNGTTGASGGDTTFGAFATSSGGAGGTRGGTCTGGYGGGLRNYVITNAFGLLGALGLSATVGGCAEYGGGSGGGGQQATVGTNGGGAIFGGGGGGASGGTTGSSTGTGLSGGAGGKNGVYNTGGGGTAGVGGAGATGGDGGNGLNPGDGGGGGGCPNQNAAGTGGKGGNGANGGLVGSFVVAGGGGGGGASTRIGGTLGLGGVGGNGYVRITTY